MTRKKSQDWPQIVFDSWMLGAEACLVIGLRGARLMSGGPEACREARLMVTEKLDAGRALSTALLSGEMGTTPRALAATTVSFYLAGVRANRRRLLKR